MRKRIVIGIILAAIAVFSTATAAEGLRFASVERVDPAGGSITVSLDATAYARLQSGERARITDFPLPGGERAELELTTFELFAPGAVVVSVDATGEHERPAPPVRAFRGSVAGDPGSLVFLALLRERVSGFVRTGGREFAVGPLGTSLLEPGAFKARIWDRSTEVGSWVCDAADQTVPSAATAERAFDDDLFESSMLAPQLALTLAVDSTTEWCAHFGNDSASAEAWLVSLVGQMSAIYDTEIQVLVQIGFLRTFCGAADPYTDGLTSLSDRSALLNELTAEWSANMGSVDRAAAHLYTHTTDGNSSGGLANTFFCIGQNCQAVLCNDNRAYGVTMFPASGATPASFELKVASHELGHNHGSPHTNCLQDGASQWISTCAIETCGSNPNCQATGCYPGPQNTAITGTLMSTGCQSSLAEIEDDTVEALFRSAAETAGCVEAAGLPGDVREQTGDGLRVGKPLSCPDETLAGDDGGLNSFWGGGGGCPNCQFAWIKRHTPSCYPYRLTRVDAVFPNVSPGRPIRVLVYVDPAGTGDPANASLVYTEDVTVQVSDFSTFNQYTLATPVTIDSGDVYLGFFDLQVEAVPPFLAAMDTSTSGDSYNTINSTNPAFFNLRPEGTWMIRGAGGPIPAGSLLLTWGQACNEVTTPDQDFGVYRGSIGSFGSSTSLTCSTNGESSWFAESPPNDSFFLAVPQTTPAEGSYGRTSAGLERAPAAAACKPQAIGACP